MSKKLGYKTAKARKDDAGGFSNNGQKKGKDAPVMKEKKIEKDPSPQIKKLVSKMMGARAKKGAPQVHGMANIIYG